MRALGGALQRRLRLSHCEGPGGHANGLAAVANLFVDLGINLIII